MKRYVVALAVTLTAGMAASEADAGGFGRHGWGGGGRGFHGGGFYGGGYRHAGYGGYGRHYGGYGRYYGGYGGYRRGGYGYGLAAGLAGLAVGGLIGGAIASPAYGYGYGGYAPTYGYGYGYQPAGYGYADYGYAGGYGRQVVYNQAPVIRYVARPIVRTRIVYVDRPVRRRHVRHHHPRWRYSQARCAC